MPAPFSVGVEEAYPGHIASPLSVSPTRHTYVRTRNGFRAISFEYIDVLDSYVITRVYNHQIQVITPMFIG